MSDKNDLSTPMSGPLGEISQEPPALEVFLDKHQMKLIVIAALLAIFAAAYVVYDGVKEGAEETAGELLANAEDVSELQSVVKNHEGTKAAYSAKVLLAEKQWEDGNQDDSISTLKAFVESDRDHPARPAAEASLAAKLASQGKAEEAIGYLEDLTEDADSRYLAPYAWIALGDIRSEKGDSEGAAKAYSMVEQEFPESTFSQEATKRLLVLKADAPVEVAASIQVPDVSFAGEEGNPSEEASPPEEMSVEDMLKAVEEGAEVDVVAPEISE